MKRFISFHSIFSLIVTVAGIFRPIQAWLHHQYPLAEMSRWRSLTGLSWSAETSGSKTQLPLATVLQPSSYTMGGNVWRRRSSNHYYQQQQKQHQPSSRYRSRGLRSRNNNSEEETTCSDHTPSFPPNQSPSAAMDELKVAAAAATSTAASISQGSSSKRNRLATLSDLMNGYLTDSSATTKGSSRNEQRPTASNRDSTQITNGLNNTSLNIMDSTNENIAVDGEQEEEEQQQQQLFMTNQGGDSMYLDTDSYLEQSNNVGPDGVVTIMNTQQDSNAIRKNELYRVILQKLAEPSPYSPSAVEERQLRATSSQSQQELLWNALRVQQNQKRESSSMDQEKAEEIRRQVFAEEDGFMKQSPIFRSFLLATSNHTYSSNAMQATAQKRKQQLTRRQEKAQASLAAKLDAFELELQAGKLANSNQTRCSHCGCLLSVYELNRYPTAIRGGIRCLVCRGENLATETKRIERSRRRQFTSYPMNIASSSSFRPTNNNFTSSQRRPVSTLMPSRKLTHNGQMSSNIGQSRYNSTGRPINIPAANRQPMNNNSQKQERAPRMQDDSTAESNDDKWEKVVDPDTGEAFYWNEKTEEMRWEI